MNGNIVRHSGQSVAGKLLAHFKNRLSDEKLSPATCTDISGETHKGLGSKPQGG
ncbi:MAG: hypothetical protein ACI8R4_000211 [Paracoccaceae bacterium]